MNILVVIIAVILFGSGIYVGLRQKTPEFKNFEDETVLSIDTNDEQRPTIEETPTNSPSPTPRVVVESNLGNYKYPNSKVVSSTSISLTLESGDNPDTITNWYKDKIKSENMNVTSFVVTKTNDNVLNKLVGANGQKELRVEIKKNASDSFVQITVSLRT